MPDVAHGTQFQNELIATWNGLGKLAWAYRFDDARDLFGLNKRMVRDFPKPADLLLVYNGWHSLCECKATKNVKGFSISMMERAQLSAATRMVAAKGNYHVAVKRMSDGIVHFVPASLVLTEQGVLSWERLAPYQWKGLLPPCLISPT